MKRVFSFQRIVVAGSMLATLGIVGCASGQSTASDEDDVAEDSAALEGSESEEQAAEEGSTAQKNGEKSGVRRGRGGHGMRGPGPGMGGPERFLFRAAADLDLTDAQKATLDEIRDEMKPADGQRGPRPEKVAELAAAIRKGSVNAAALAPAATAADPMKEHRGKVVAAVQKLHDTLTPAQRQELVADLQTKVAEHAGDVSGRRGPKADEEGEARGPHGPKALFMLHGLDVSDEQEAKITAALEKAGLGAGDAPEPPDFDTMRAKADAALVAFAKDDFAAAAALPEPPGGAHAGKMGDGPKRFVESLAVIVPLLDESQREALAKRVEDGPMGHHGRKGHHERQ